MSWFVLLTYFYKQLRVINKIICLNIHYIELGPVSSAISFKPSLFDLNMGAITY